MPSGQLYIVSALQLPVIICSSVLQCLLCLVFGLFEKVFIVSLVAKMLIWPSVNFIQHLNQKIMLLIMRYQTQSK